MNVSVHRVPDLLGAVRDQWEEFLVALCGYPRAIWVALAQPWRTVEPSTLVIVAGEEVNCRPIRTRLRSRMYT